jgi:choline kinase
MHEKHKREESSSITRAVIVAAGRSTRLHPLTLEKPKGLLEVAGEALLVRSVRLLRESGIREIAVVVGFEASQIVAALEGQCSFLVNPFYPLCNNMGSLWFAREFVGSEPFVYLHGDLIYDERILKEALVAGSKPVADLELVTDFGPVDEEAMKVRASTDGFLIESSKDIPLNEAAGEWTGIAAVRKPKPVFQMIEELLLAGSHNVYDTAAFTRLASEGMRMLCSPTHGLPWKEIDFASDLEEARRLFGGNR